MKDPEKAQLLSLSGPLAPQSIPITGPRFSIGRESKNDLEVPDLLVSRLHCSIITNDETWSMVDEGSANGTWINGTPINGTRPLRNGDLIGIGGSEFQFTFIDTEVEFCGSEVVSTSTLHVRVDKQPERSVRDLAQLLALARVLNEENNLQSIEREVLRSVFEVTSADRGAVIIIDGSLDQVRSSAGLDHRLVRCPITMSRTLATRALREKTAVLINDVQQSGGDVPSLDGVPALGLAMVPFVAGGKNLGILYVETRSEFDESAFQWLIAVAGIASLAVENLQNIQNLGQMNRQLIAESRKASGLIGECPAIRSLCSLIARVGRSDSTVLILGETGTGKEVVARQLHASSSRRDGPFVAINCAVLSENLLESELFGHERGAFTGATAQKLGKIEVAQKGTLFLDEIGELALSLQAKLLRALQEKQFERVGGLRPVSADIRLLAATNRDLRREVAAGRFRADLYFRVQTVSLTLPPLRERADDIRLLSEFFLSQYAQQFGRRILGFSPDALRVLCGYSWPGNIRELQNVIERAVVLGTGEWIEVDDLSGDLLEGLRTEAEESPSIPLYHQKIREAKKQILLQSIVQAGGSYSKAASLLGIHANNLHRLIRTLDLKAQIEELGHK